MRSVWALCFLAAPLCAVAQSGSNESIASDAQIREILVHRVGAHADTFGIVVGVLEPHGRRIVAHGSERAGGPPLSGDTTFEIGSITHAFTSLMRGADEPPPEAQSASLGQTRAQVGTTDNEAYASLLLARIAAPLGLTRTVAVEPPRDGRPIATGHNWLRALVAVPPLDTRIVHGAGVIRSTANEMLEFLAAHSQSTAGPLASAIQRAIRGGEPAPGGWLVMVTPKHRLLSRHGATQGFNAFAGFDLERKVAVVVLANVATAGGVSDLGHHLLNPDFPLLPADSPLLGGSPSLQAGLGETARETPAWRELTLDEWNQPKPAHF